MEVEEVEGAEDLEIEGKILGFVTLITFKNATLST